MLASSAIDAMMKAKGYQKGWLYDRINKTVEDHLITEDMGTWAHHVRLEANDPRHADEKRPHVEPEEAHQCIEFATALAQLLFVLPARVKKGIKDASGEPTEESAE